MLLTRAALLGGAAAAATAAGGALAARGLLGLVTSAGHDTDPAHAAHGLWNDFYSYWAAGHILNQGGNPYDQGQLRATYQAAGIHPEVGSGYSYPLLFAQLMRPLSLLGPGISALIFAAIGLAALWTAVALLLDTMPRLSRRGALLWGVGIGMAPPVAGSLYVGQANLIILPLLALAYRRVAPGPTLALAAAIKLFPGAGLLALLARGRREWPELARGALLLTGLVVLPWLVSPRDGYGVRLLELMAPDPYWTNVSLNGWISRLVSPRAGLASAVRREPVEMAVLMATMLAGGAVLAVMWRSRHRAWSLTLALALAFGVVVAPKNSIWNDAPLVLCLVAVWPLLENRSRLRALTLTAIAFISLGSLGVLTTLLPGPPPASTALASLTIWGALLLGAVVSRLLLSCEPAQPSEAVARAGALSTSTGYPLPPRPA